MDIERRHVLIALRTAALLFALLASGGIFVLDRPIALWSAGYHVTAPMWDQVTSLMDQAVFKEVSNFLLGPILMLAAGLLLLMRATRGLGWSLLFLGIVQFGSTIVADLSKPQLGRLRPFEALAEPGGIDRWFVGANSFPSGHVAFYAGLFFPLMMILPRWSLLRAIPPLFIAAARVVSHDHYLSDAAASLALAAIFTVAFRFIQTRADAHA